jgi:hypothetical protein
LADSNTPAVNRLLKPVLALLGVAGWTALAQAPGTSGAAGTPVPSTGIIRNWGISLRDNQSGRVQVRFSSSEAVPAKSDAGGLLPAVWEVTALKLETFRSDESPDFVIESPACRVNVATRDAISPGTFSAYREVDGLKLTGTGFNFISADQKLVVSNDVRIEIRATLFKQKPAKQ